MDLLLVNYSNVSNRHYIQYKKPSNSNETSNTRPTAERTDSDSRSKPNIEKYFTRSSNASAALVLDRKNPPKRARSPESGSTRDTEHLSKRAHHSSPSQTDISRTGLLPTSDEESRRDDNDWIGPYGI